MPLTWQLPSLQIFWDDKTGPRKPFIVTSNDAGETFGNPIMLNATATSNATQTPDE